jgi:cysteine desulfurase
VTDHPAGVPDAADAGDVPALRVDARGLRCPAPVIELARRIAEVPLGAVVAVLADDEAARLDIPAWCAMRGHDYLGEPVRHDHRVRRR